MMLSSMASSSKPSLLKLSAGSLTRSGHPLRYKKVLTDKILLKDSNTIYMKDTVLKENEELQLQFCYQ